MHFFILFFQRTKRKITGGDDGEESREEPIEETPSVRCQIKDIIRGYNFITKVTLLEPKDFLNHHRAPKQASANITRQHHDIIVLVMQV